MRSEPLRPERPCPSSLQLPSRLMDETPGEETPLRDVKLRCPNSSAAEVLANKVRATGPPGDKADERQFRLEHFHPGDVGIASFCSPPHRRCRRKRDECA